MPDTGRQIVELIEKSSEFGKQLETMLVDLRAQVADSTDPKEKEVLGELIRSMEHFLSLPTSPENLLKLASRKKATL